MSVGIAMTELEREELWVRRLFEAEAGMSRYLAHRQGGKNLRGWMRVREEMFSSLPSPDHPDVQGWQSVFFRAQALMERFLVSQFGHDELTEWAVSNAEIHRFVEPTEDVGAPLRAVRRMARQAELYGSRYVLDESGPEPSVAITHCAIWDYRRRAQSRGVTLTLTSPCEYCVPATAANFRSQGAEPDHELRHDDKEAGCSWAARSRTDAEG